MKEAYLEIRQASMIEIFAKIIDSFCTLIVFATKLHLDV